MRKISTDRIRVYEYGLSHTMLLLLPSSFLINHHSPQTLYSVFLHLVKSVSPRSYLLRNVELPSLSDLGINLDNQRKRYERLSGIKIEDLRVLSEQYLIETKEGDLLSEVTPTMRELLERMGLKDD